MKLPLRRTVAVTFAALAAISVSVVAGINYIGGRNAVIEVASSEMRYSIDEASDSIRRMMLRSAAATIGIANLSEHLVDWRDPDALLGSLNISVAKSPHIYSAFVGFPDGALVQVINLNISRALGIKIRRFPGDAAVAWRFIEPISEDTPRPATWSYLDEAGDEVFSADALAQEASSFDPRTRPWYLGAQSIDGLSISEPYIFESLESPGITYAHRMKNAAGAVAGVDVSLGYLVDIATRLKPGENGLIMLLDDQFRVIARPTSDSDERTKGVRSGQEFPLIDDVDIPLARAVFNATDDTEGTYVPFSLNGERYLGVRVVAGDVEPSIWTIVGAASVDDFTHDHNEVLFNSILISGVILLVSVVVITFMAGWISLPVVRLRTIADQITRLDVSPAAPLNTPFKEIQQLQQSMDRLRSALDTFLRFVPIEVVRDQLESGKKADIGGKRREITLLFSDIENFTTISERMTPEQIMAQVSVYFELLSAAIQDHDGVIDKFIGDAIMAFWNAPRDNETHVEDACRAVLEARYHSEDLNKEFTEEGLPAFRTRFGLHCCEALVGNVGAPDRMQYTCLGSGVNLAARIEGLNKLYGTQILVTDTVRRRAPSSYLFRRIDIVRVAGTTRPMTIYELLGERETQAKHFVGPDTVRQAVRYEQAFDFYLHKDFEDALHILEDLNRETPEDMVVAGLLEKCWTYTETPPPASWDGSTSLDEK